MALVKMVGPAVRLVVHNRSCAAVAPQHHLFRTVATFLTEPQLRQALAEGLRFRWAGGKFDKFQTEIVWRCRGVKQRCIAVVQLPVGLLFQPLQRAVAIFRRCAVRRSAEAVIENFQRPRAAIAAAGQIAGKVHQRQLSLPWEAAEMAAPLQNIHLHQRRIGQLQKGNFVHRDFRQPLQRIVAGEDMKAIEDDTERRAVDAFHPFPGLIPAVDVRSPGQRFVADDDLFLLRQRRQRGEICHLQRNIGGTVRLHIAAQEQCVAAQLMHQGEFALRPLHIRRKLAATGAFKIAKGLKKRDF